MWGKASDILRISILNHFGGVYSDLNYVFNRDVTEEVHKYNFFTSTELSGDDYFDNYFFASSPNHPILKEALRLIENNLTAPADYIAKAWSEEVSTTLSTADPIYLAYYSQANQNGNKDVVYPPSPYGGLAGRVVIVPDSWNIQFLRPVNIDGPLSKVCPMTNFKAILRSREMCGLESHFIGHDQHDTNTKTWLDEK